MWYKGRWWFLALALALSGCYMHTTPFALQKKITGVSLVAGREVTQEEKLNPVDSVNAGWVAIIPYAFTNGHVPELRFNHARQWYGESVTGVAEQIAIAHAKGLKVMLKPHVWVRGDGWPGQFKLESETDWKNWEASYTAYILAYLQVADSLNVALFCIGTEFNEAVKARPAYWKELALLCRQQFKGELTYAANWDSYQEVSYWDALDYIGVDAYFPLSDEKTPSIRRLREGWEKPKAALKEIAEKFNKPVLFTEYGYRSADHAAARPWEMEEGERPGNLEAQINTYEALYTEFWDEPWFAGGFLWKWFPDHERAGGSQDNDYTPQNKPTEHVIRKWYSRSEQTSLPVSN